MADTIDEINIIERLDSALSLREFFITANQIYEEAINTVIRRIFRDDYQAVKLVVHSLLNSSGPLGDLSVRLKLIYGLGVVSGQTYNDIDLFFKIKNFLNNDGNKYEFTDQVILKKIRELSTMTGMVLDFPQPGSDMDPELYLLHTSRIQTMIRSGLSLAVVDIYDELNTNSSRYTVN